MSEHSLAAINTNTFSLSLICMRDTVRRADSIEVDRTYLCYWSSLRWAHCYYTGAVQRRATDRWRALRSAMKTMENFMHTKQTTSVWLLGTGCYRDYILCSRNVFQKLIPKSCTEQNAALFSASFWYKFLIQVFERVSLSRWRPWRHFTSSRRSLLHRPPAAR